MGIVKPLGPCFADGFSHQGWRETALQLVLLVPGCDTHLGTAARLGQFLVFLSCPQMAQGNNMAAINPKLLSEGVHGHFGQGLTSASCGQQGSSLGAAKQLDQKKADPSGANTQHDMFHLDCLQPSNAMMFGEYSLFTEVSYHKMQFASSGQINPILYLFCTTTTVLGQQLSKRMNLYTGRARSSSPSARAGGQVTCSAFPFQVPHVHKVL